MAHDEDEIKAGFIVLSVELKPQVWSNSKQNELYFWISSFIDETTKGSFQGLPEQEY